MTRRGIHRMSAVLISVFLMLHVANHLVSVVGQAQHIAVMEFLRPFYRNLLVEPLLLLALLVQIATGVPMALRALHAPSGWVGWLQPVSGLYMAFFIIIHVAAVLGGRHVLGLDTNFNFAAAGFHAGAWTWFFAPYYFLAVAALFAHLGCALYWNLTRSTERQRLRVTVLMAGGGAVLSAAIVLALAGAYYPVNIPAAYLATYE